MWRCFGAAGMLFGVWSFWSLDLFWYYCVVVCIRGGGGLLVCEDCGTVAVV